MVRVAPLSSTAEFEPKPKETTFKERFTIISPVLDEFELTTKEEEVPTVAVVGAEGVKGVLVLTTVPELIPAPTPGF